MEVEIFINACKYKEWLESRSFALEIISTLVFDNEIVVTYKRK